MSLMHVTCRYIFHLRLRRLVDCLSTQKDRFQATAVPRGIYGEILKLGQVFLRSCQHTSNISRDVI